MQGKVNRVANNGKAFNAEIGGSWYGCGFSQPDFKEGDVLEFDFEQRGKYMNLGKYKVLGTEKGAPAAPAKSQGSQGFDDRNTSIAYQSSRKDALYLVEILLANQAVPLPAKKADQADAILALVNDYAAQFYIRLEDVVKAGGCTLEDLVPTQE